MSKTILITGATDGIGLLTAKTLAKQGHKVLLHGRNEAKLLAVAKQVGGETETYLADLTNLTDVRAMAEVVLAGHDQIDILINNAGVLKAARTKTNQGHDIRFVVNTFSPYVLTRNLFPILPKDGRVVNLSSAAQSPVDLAKMAGNGTLDEMDAYAQSKLAITIWTRELAKAFPDGPVIVAVNPGSLLASKMVKEGFGIAGNDLGIGANILCRAALSDTFSDVSGQYFDNDVGQFTAPHSAALDPQHSNAVMKGITEAIASIV